MLRTKAFAADLPLCSPAVVMYRNEDCQVIKISLPGVREESIEVCCEHGDLVIRGEASDRRYYRLIPLHYQAARAQIRTSLHGDVLEICVPNPRKEDVPSVPLA